jgi:hypothetical protein
MEIMQFACLRPYGLSRKRAIQRPDIYGDLDSLRQYMKFDFQLDHEFDLLWEHRNNKVFPIGLYNFKEENSQKRYARGPNPEFSAKYNGSEDPDFGNQTLHRLAHYDLHQMLSACLGPGRNMSCLGKFVPKPTDDGICFAFNAANVFTVYKHTPYIEMFQKVYDYSTESQRLKNSKFSNLNTMLLVLDSFSSKFYDSLRGSFKIGINTDKDFMAVSSEGIEVFVGHETIIHVTPHKTTSNDKLRKVSRLKRKCQFSDEIIPESVLFKNYSQQSCLFECQLKKSAEYCGCIPWNYPHFGPIETICDGQQSFCFQNEMNIQNTKGYSTYN